MIINEFDHFREVTKMVRHEAYIKNSESHVKTL
jgi:hypothetical protein